MKHTNIYFDEAGNSGDNLLDKNQPIYVLSSNNYTDDEVQKILLPLNDINSEELHFKQLKKYSKSRNKLIEVLNSDFLDSSRIKIYYADKRYALMCRIVDTLIEPIMYFNNVDLYMQGKNIMYANGLYIIDRCIDDKALFNLFLHNFQKMIRDKKDETIDAFYTSVDDILHKYGKISRMVADIFQFLSKTKLSIQWLVGSSEKYSLDIGGTTFIEQCTKWDKELDTKFSVFHDNSKQIDHWKGLITFLSDISIPRTEVGYDYRKHNFPLMVNNLELVDSKDYKQIQLADIISSSIAYCMKIKYINKDNSDKFANDLSNSKLLHLGGTPLLGSSQMTPEELGTTNSTGIDAINFLVEVAKDYFDKNK